jgi:hypothetical protein
MKTVSMLAVMALVGCASAFDDSVAPDDRPSATAHVRWMPDAESQAIAGERAQAKSRSLALVDHGGSVLAQSTTYAVYWGPASDFPADLQAGMAALLGGLNGSSYLGIGAQYMRGAPISTTYGGALVDASAPPSHAPSTSALGAEVCHLVAAPDPNALYVVFTSNAPKLNYCAWHDKATCNGVTFQVAYVPNQAVLTGCSPYVKSNLHCNTYSDGTVASADSVAHELMESVTDAHIDAWYDGNHAEIADKCEYDYQGCVALTTGSWQIQSEWSNALGGCQQQ